MRDDALIGSEARREAARRILGNSAPQLGQPRRRPVVRLPGLERLLERAHDVRRRIEIRLADLEVHDANAAGLQVARFLEDLERSLGFEAGDSVG